MIYINKDFGYENRPPYVKDSPIPTSYGPTLARKDFPNKKIIAPGLDYSSWNGAMFIGECGELFAIRFNYCFKDNEYKDELFWKAVNNAGDYSSQSNYAIIETDHIRLCWAKKNEETLICEITAKDTIELLPEIYAPYNFPATFKDAEGEINGNSVKVGTIEGSKKITGGHVKRENSYYVLTEQQGAYIRFYCINDKIYLNNSQFHIKSGEKKYFVGVIGNEGIFNFPILSEKECVSIIDENKTKYENECVKGTGYLGSGIKPIINGMRWMKTYFPLEKTAFIPAGRAWMMDGNFNIWGWDESINGLLISYGGNIDEVNAQFLNLIGDERLGLLTAYSGLLKYHDLNTLTTICKGYMKELLLNSELVSAGEGNWGVGKGMDDTPMREEWRKKGEMFSLDLSCMKCWNIEILYKMLLKLGDEKNYSSLKIYHTELKSKIHETFWNEEEGLYMNRYINGDWSITKSPTSFYPMLCKIPDSNSIKRMMGNLTDEKKFWGEYVIPSLSKDDDEYGKPSKVPNHTMEGDHFYPPFCYWRGNIWAPTNFLVYLGLSRYMLDDIAAEFAEKSVNLWKKSYDKYGWTCENYYPDNGEKSSMSTTNQSWGYLLPLMGIIELIDSEIWEDEAIKFSTLIMGNNQVENLLIRSNRYSVNVSDMETSLSINDKLVFIGKGGKFVVRNYKMTDTSCSFRINAKSKLQIQINLTVQKISFEIEKGIYQVTFENGVISIYPV